MRCIIVVFLFCFVLASCSNYAPKIECNEIDCNQPATEAAYCPAHNKVYLHEREFYPLITRLIDSIRTIPEYATNSTFRIEDIYIHYVRPVDENSPYILKLYCHYCFQNENYYVCYQESEKQTGALTIPMPCTQEAFAHIQKAAHGGLSTHNVKERSKHYSTPASDKYLYNEYFSVNLNDFKIHPQ